MGNYSMPNMPLNCYATGNFPFVYPYCDEAILTIVFDLSNG